VVKKDKESDDAEPDACSKHPSIPNINQEEEKEISEISNSEY
jgi:hypothetical protein